MGNSILSLLFVLGLSSLAVAQYDGPAKGGYRRPPENTDSASFPANENGTCYKRMPYDQAEAANATGHIKLVPGSYQGVKQDRRVWVTVIDCCDGYQRNPTSGTCETHCDDGCVAGQCIGGVCTCEEGWAAEQGVCKPQCRTPCQRDAYCFSPDFCQCKFGYEEDAYGQCKPVCPGDCANGDCIAPRVCRCRPGYMLNERQECAPVCEGGCANGECTSPGVCVCHPGFSNPPGDRETCIEGGSQSQCRNGCQNGRCVGPDQCVCNQGYRMDPRTRSCVASYDHSEDPYDRESSQHPTQRPEQGDPYARYCPSGCQNGRCVGPNQCSCNPGYRMDHRTQTCLREDDRGVGNPRGESQDPSRQCYGGCQNGQCVGPNECICNEGFVMDSRTQTCVDFWSGQSTPSPNPPQVHGQTSQCRNGCRYGQCMGPDQCVCNRGYRKDPRTEICVPHYGGSSSSQEPRRPESGNQEVQESQCPESCPNGYCVGPHQCVCNQGYRMDPRTRVCTYAGEDTSHIYKVNSQQSHSGQPSQSHHCSDGCRNGQCVGPEQCVCNPGYQMDSRTQTCRPSYGSSSGSGQESQTPYPETPSRRPTAPCHEGCPNGHCVHNQCVCDFGSRLDPRTRICTPITTTPSQTHTYYPDLSTLNEDTSQCPDGCRNGRCVGPYQCVCNPGYRMDPRTQVCMPQTHAPQNPPTPSTQSSSLCRNGCRYGQCLGPDHCVCNPGYRMDPRTQTCRPHYGSQDPHSDTTQRPDSSNQYGSSSMCPEGCRNGQCVGPNQCVCNPGYRQDPRTRACTYQPEDTSHIMKIPPTDRHTGQCGDRCQNGECVGPDQCVCNPGYDMDIRTLNCRPQSGPSDQSSSCPQGQRMDPRTRTCVASYGAHAGHPDPNNPYGSLHQCRDGCPNGQCVGPNQCVCNQGYLMNPRTQQCIPSRADDSWGVEGPNTQDQGNPSLCRDGCPNGQCVGPNQCVCNPGYSVHPSTKKCEVSYGGGGSDPHSGGHHQEPSCDRPCLNGRCTGYNECSCNRGYMNDEQDPSRCVPVCHGGCQNGVCTAPNYCICSPGYTKDRSVKGSQRCIPV